VAGRRSPHLGEKPVKAALNACRDHLVTAAIFSALLNLLYLAPSIYMLQVYDRAVPTRGLITLAMLTLIFLLAAGTIAALDYIRSRILIRASARLDRLLSGQILSALLRTGADGKRSSALLRDFDSFRQTATGLGVLALFDAPWSPIYILVCFFLHWALGAMALVGAILLLIVAWRNERATIDPIKQANVIANLAYRGIDGSMGSAGVVKALGMRDALVARHLGERAEGLAMQTDASFSSAYYVSMTKSCRLMLQSLALGLGALLAMEQQISGGAIFAASLLVSRALAPIEQITGAWKSLTQSRTTYRAIFDLFQDQGQLKTPTALPPPSGDMLVQRLSVVSPARDRLILNDVGF
jgi:ATP-binding cassette subfamily C protein